MRFANKAVVAAGLGFTAAVVVGCGSSGQLLSSAQATSLRAELSKASTALEDGRCGAAAGYISDFQTRVDELGGVNHTLANNLQAGATKIENLATKDCPVSTTPQPTHTRTTPKPKPPKTTPTVTTVTQVVTTTASTATQTDTSTSTSTGTTTDQTTTGTGTTSTSTYTQPGSSGLTGATTSSTPTTSTQSTTTGTTGGSALNGGGA